MMIDTQATPLMAREVIKRIRRVTSKPVKYVVLSHYHAVRARRVGPGHTGGDSIVWLRQERVLFSGDLMEYNAGIYTGDAHLEEWPDTLDKLRALKPRAYDEGRSARYRPGSPLVVRPDRRSPAAEEEGGENRGGACLIFQ